MSEKSIFLFAGESSGDVHGEKILSRLHKEFPNAHFFGVGGPKMRSLGFECVMPMERFEVMGFIDVFFALFKLIRQFTYLRNLILKKKPDILLLIDYPTFNLALAKSLRKKGFSGKICQYICPSVWAWGKRRIPKMEMILDHLFVIFPFEQKIFNPEKLSVTYVGNPLMQSAFSTQPPIQIDPKYRVIALFPGSREKELYRNFPIQMRVIAKLLRDHPDLYLVISISKPSFSLVIDDLLKKEGILRRDRIMFVSSLHNHAIMKRASLAIAKSGTNNLELALQGVPTIVTYAIDPIDVFIARRILRIHLSHYCIVNILANERIFPELYGPNFTEEALYSQATAFLSSEESLRSCGEKSREIAKILDTKVPDQEIAGVLKNWLV